MVGRSAISESDSVGRVTLGLFVEGEIVVRISEDMFEVEGLWKELFVTFGAALENETACGGGWLPRLECGSRNSSIFFFIRMKATEGWHEVYASNTRYQ